VALTIHYQWAGPCHRSPDEARRIVTALHEAAEVLPFKHVGPIYEFPGDEPHRWDKARNGFVPGPLTWLFQKASGWVSLPPDEVPALQTPHTVAPEQVIGFMITVGDGCQPMAIGLRLLPQSVIVTEGPDCGQEVAVPDGDRWGWSAYCRTEFAADEGCGGEANLIHCHALVVTMLDVIRGSGLVELSLVYDHAGYAHRRHLAPFVQEASTSLVTLASLAAEIRDRLRGMQYESEVTGDEPGIGSIAVGIGATSWVVGTLRMQALSIASLIREPVEVE
jgi:hypothetical protein